MISEAGGCELRDGEFHEETRADWLVVFHMNAPTVLGDDASGDCQAETGSAILRRKMREEKFVFVLRRDAVTGVGHANLDGFGVRMRSKWR